MQEVVKDFNKQGYDGSPQQFLCDNLGYSQHNCRKSLVKFINKYFWIRCGDNLPIPPKWVPTLDIDKD